MQRIDRYEFVGKLGEGGMGVVYRAFDTKLRRSVAVKVIRMDPLGDPSSLSEQRARLEREARAAARLQHPNIVAVFDQGESDGVPFVVMELVENEPLHHLIDANSLSSADILRVLNQVASALDYAHSKDVIHRDIKPENILIQSNGLPKITDFGIAKAPLSETTGNLTSAGMGTPFYMSPEQLMGGKVTTSTDQWSLAVTAYQMLAGRRPFDADTVFGLAEQILKAAVPFPIHPRFPISREVFSVLARALSKDPALRYPSCTHFVSELSAALAGKENVVRGRRMKQVWLWIALAAAVLVASVTWLVSRPSEIFKPRPQTVAQTTTTSQPAAPSTPQAGETRSNPIDGLTYGWVPPGPCWVGCVAGEVECGGVAKPMEERHLAKGFWMGQTEVTVEAFKRYADNQSAAVPPTPGFNPDWQDAAQPIVNVTWEEAAAYCRWAGGRIPTEEEGECAARGGSQEPRLGPIESIAVFEGNSGGKPSATRQKVANAFGLHDLLGNVWEWVGSPSDAERSHVLRGGSWNTKAALVHAASRRMAAAGSDTAGFRCVLEDR
ncbi:MAG: protein kinase [Bryobacteraceae bacterium]|nr:protein kinase [Bryobacteraceae bacterium]